MAGWPVYSERFVKLAAQGSVAYTVPAGHRAVVTCITAANWSGTTRGGQVLAGGATVWRVSMPGTLLSLVEEMRVVVYAGEQVVAANDGADLYVTVSGYLFQDVTGRSAPPPGAAGKPLPELPGPPE